MCPSSEPKTIYQHVTKRTEEIPTVFDDLNKRSSKKQKRLNRKGQG